MTKSRAGALGVALLALSLLGGCLQSPPTLEGQEESPVDYDALNVTSDRLMDFATDEQKAGAGEWFILELLSPESRTVRVGLELELADETGPLADPSPEFCGYFYNQREGMLFWGDHEGTMAQMGSVVLDQRNPGLTETSSDRLATYRSRIETLELKPDVPASIVVAFGPSSEARLDAASVRLLEGGEVHYRVVASGALECRSGLTDFDDGTTVRIGNRAVAIDLVDNYDVPAPSTLLFLANPSIEWELRRGETLVERGENSLAIREVSADDWHLSIPQVEPSDCRLLWRMVLHGYEQRAQLFATAEPECELNDPSHV